ncbi:hypothetical protein ACFST9_22020 [Hymenobacter monticola]|uniref:Uncharacterized protein n=1 Tax=Hymenobacter monticola TaxID=1705399 RepID=A0ABY4B4Y6_9BACT|nr:hypothetical protein [Hymenobacter monticola]UOE34220.1 hypothetical protein MTP16_00885 [Hymenobacter monticola]
MLYIVKYTGPFGYLKPWTAVRDGETYSQQFLTPSVLEGMQQKLGVTKILRHKLTYTGLSMQQEQTHPRGWIHEKKKQQMTRPRAILVRGVMLAPELHLAFASAEEAEVAASQHLCLCRNEDIVLPVEQLTLTEAAFDQLPGFELRPTVASAPGAFLVGFNRFAQGAAMHGRLEIVGNPIRPVGLMQ